MSGSASSAATGSRVVAAPVEAPAERRRRFRIGILLLALGLVAALLAFSTAAGPVTFRFSGQFADHPLHLSVAARPLAFALAAYLVVVAAVHLVRGLRGRALAVLGVAFGIAFVVAFLCWAAAGKTFPVTNQLQGTLNLATPLILGALAGVLGETAGVINVAIEGQFLVGAFAAAVIGSVTGSAVLGVVAGIAGGVLVAWLLAVFAIRYLVNQVVLGVVLVVFATGITGFCYDQFVQGDTERFNSPPVLAPIAIPGLSRIPVLGSVLFDQTWLVYAMYLAVILVTVVVFRTRWGLRVRAVGEHPRAADTVGIKVTRVRYQAVLAGGVLAGLGGSFFTVGFSGGFSKEMTAGNGFIALAALIMGRWRPVGATAAALFFGFATQLQGQLQILQTPISGKLLLMVPYIATVIAVAGLVGRVRAPRADGEPYVKE